MKGHCKCTFFVYPELKKVLEECCTVEIYQFLTFSCIPLLEIAFQSLLCLFFSSMQCH